MEMLLSTPRQFPPFQPNFYSRMPLIESTTLAKSNVYVGNLPLNFTTDSLMSLFSPFGFILRCKVGMNRTGKNAGYGFVQFDNDESASKAIVALDGYSIGENVIHVSVASGRSKRAPRPKTNVYFSGLPSTCGTSDLNSMCEQFGRIIGSRVLVNPVTNQSRGYGFVRFDTHENAIKAIASLNGTVPPNGVEPLVVKFAREPTDPQHPSQRKLLREAFQAQEGLPMPQREASDDSLSARFSHMTMNPMQSPLYRVPDYSYTGSYPPTYSVPLYNPVQYPAGGTESPSIAYTSPVTVPRTITLGKDTKTFEPTSVSSTSTLTSSTLSSTTGMPSVVSVSGFPIKIKKQELDALFSKYGKIISSRYVPNDESTAGLGKGTVRFESHNEALRAISGLNSTTPFGKDMLKVTLMSNPTPKVTKESPTKTITTLEPKTLTPTITAETLKSAPNSTPLSHLSHYPLPSYYPTYPYSPTIQYRYVPTSQQPSGGSVYTGVPEYKYPVSVASMTSTSIPSTNPRSAGTYSEYSGYQVIDPRTGYPNYLGFPSNPIYVPPGTGTAGTTGSYYPPTPYPAIPSSYQTLPPSTSGAGSGTGSVTTSMNSASFVSTTVSPTSTTTTKSTSTTTTTTTPYFTSRPMSDFYYSAAYR